MKSYTRLNRKSNAFRSTAAQAGPRAGKPPAKDEREVVLPLMRAAGAAGINRNDFLKGSGPLDGRQVTQIGRLIHQLEKEGFVFKHERRESSRFVTYILIAEPFEPRKPMPTTKPGWKSEPFRFGKAVQAEPSQGTFLSFERGAAR
jgi:hypothetical protein